VPKRVQEIKNFHAGIMSSPEEGDIPIDASPNSLNIEPVNVDGRLEGIPDDSTTRTGVDARVMATINDDGTYHMVYYDDTASRIKQVKDLYSSPTVVDLSGSDESANARPSMEVYNKDVHIGMGRGNKARWAGFIDHDQFGTTAPATIQIDNADLTSPTAFTDVYKFVEKSGYIYGVEWEGTRVYKFKVSDKSFVAKSEAVLNSSQGICLSGDESHLWILDMENNQMKITKVDLDTMQAEFTNTLTTSFSNLSDIIVIGNNIWVSKHGTHSANALWYIAESSITADATLSLTSKTPNGTSSSASQSWQQATGSLPAYEDINVNYVIPKVSLAKVGGTTRVGWLCEVLNNTNSSNAVYYHFGSSANNTIETRHIIQAISTSQSTSNGPERLFRLDTNNDFLSTNIMYGISTKAGASGMIMYGDSEYLDNTVFKLLGSTLDADSITSRYDDIAVNTGATLAIKNGYGVMHNSDSNISAFEGHGAGRWLHGSAIGSMTSALETNLNITFRQSVADYGDGSATPNAKIGFKDTSTQFYKVSYMYDGFQESPLSDDFTFQGVTTNGKGVDVTLELRNIATLSKRISHVQLYRADADNRNGYVEPSGFYRLVEKFQLNTTWSLVTESSPWSNYRTKTFTDKNTASASFDARIGISEVLENITPNYSLSTQLNNTHFVANIKQTTLGVLSNYILKSKPLRFDQFNYAEDFLALPSKPTAIVGFNGRLYAFDENNTYRIEPNNFYIEDIYEGVGCLGPDAIKVTEYGLFFADKSNIYMHDGRTPKPIGNNIKRGDDNVAIGSQYRTDKHYDNTIKHDFIRLGFDGNRRCLLVFVKYVLSNSTSYYCWAYTITKGRWDLWHVGSANPKAVVSGKDGEVYFSNGTDLEYFLGGTGNRTWTWYSKELSAGADSVDKRFIEVYVGGAPSSAPSIVIDGTTVTATVTESNKKNSIPNTNRKGKKLRVSLSGQTGSVDSIGYIYRPLVVSDGNI